MKNDAENAFKPDKRFVPLSADRINGEEFAERRAKQIFRHSIIGKDVRKLRTRKGGKKSYC